MDPSIPGSTTNSPLSIPSVFGDNVQDLLSTGALNVNPTGIIVVNSTNDTVDDPNSGVTTLRDAINQANADNREDLIVFDRSLFSNPQTITLSGTELDITHNLDIIAPRDSLTGANLVEVSGNKASRVFEIEKEATVSFDGLIIADGSATGDDGGGIKNSGTLTLDSSIIRNNSISDPSLNSVASARYLAGGGGIYNTGTAKVLNSTLNNNHASGVNGGAEGGGIFNAGNLLLSTSTLNNNSAATNFLGSGGGIYNAGILEVSNSTMSGNSALLAGGGIYNNGSSIIENSTLTLNSALNGGGVCNDFVFSSPNLIVRSGTVNVQNTIIAANLMNSISPDVSGTFSSNGYNLIGDSTGSTGFGVTGDIVGTSDNPIDPRLAPLDFNGGSTQTIALLPDSPAIGAGDPTVLDTDTTTDQRGFPRRASDVRTDIGAFEFSS